MKMFTKSNSTVLFTVCFILQSVCIFSQEYRNSGFTKPVHLPFHLAGSFGEPRPDHFHSGIDIKTNGVEGEPVFAVYDGYISRIRVSPYGYGRAIYITHPNGFTTVYGHLSRFNEAIQKYVHAQHYLTQKSELDLVLDASVFPVKQNDTIAFSGNTGGSTAPHLHFEVRNTQTEHALNPLDFYPRSFYVDTIPPQINEGMIYYSNDLFYNSSSAEIIKIEKRDKYFTTEKPIIFDNAVGIFLSLKGFDKQDNSENKNGIKKIEVYQNDSFVFKYDLTEIDFDKTRMCNAFVDYGEMMNDSGYFYNCYQLSNNTLPIYTGTNGFLKIENEITENITVFCYDYNNNKTEIHLQFYREDNLGLNNTDKLPIDKSVKIMSNNLNSISKDNFKISFPQKTFYDDLSISLKTIHNKVIEKYTVDNSNNIIPLQKSAKIEFKSSIKKNRNKIVIVRQDSKGKETALKTTFDKTKFYADTKELGSFYLKYDTTKPIIELSALNSQLSTLSIQAKITDNLSGINTYNGYIDDHWVNFYYDAKNDVIQYNLDEYCPKGEHLLKIIVTDNVGNKTTVQQKFKY